MRRGRIAVVAALPAAALALVPAAASGSAADPTLRFVRLIPPTARGANFDPGTTVRVTLVAGQTKLSRLVRASNGGAFVVGFGLLPREDRCSGKVMLFAAGSGGQRAYYRLPLMNCIANRLDRAAVVAGTVDKASAVSVDRASVETIDSAGSSSAKPAAGLAR